MPPKTDYTQNQAKLVKEIKKTQEEILKLQSNLIDGDKVQLEIIAEKNKKLNELNKIQKENNKEIDKALNIFEEMDDMAVSIGNSLQKNGKFVEIMSNKFSTVKELTSSIGEALKQGAATNKKTQNQILAANAKYADMQVSIAGINKQKALGDISEEQRISQIKQQADAFRDVVDVIDLSKVESEELKAVLMAMKKEGESFAEAMKHSQINSEKLDSVFESFSGVPALGEVNRLLKTNIKDTVAFKAAVFALGAALGKAAYDYFGAPIKAGLQADKERQQNQIDNIAEVSKISKEAQFIPAKISQERLENEIEGNETIRKATIDSQFAAQRAANSFTASMKTGAAQFERAAKTALFGKGIGSVGYGAAQMQLAGISADKVASAMSESAIATGKMPTGKMGADMAIMAERTGQSVGDIAQINEAFQRMDGMSANVAMNMQEGMRNMADQAGIDLGNLMREVAESSKEALGYQIKSGPALAKAVAYTQSMGVNFGDVAKAGKNMVMNYKDSIKAEMQLSSLLGEQVDLSEVRAKFAAGDTTGALESLKAQGLNPEDMDMFQQDALQQALGGMDLSSLQKISQNKGAQVGDLKAGNAGKGNQQFLSTTQAAEAALNSKTAQISADEAIVDAELSKKIGDAYLADPNYKKHLEAQNAAAISASALAHAMTDAWLASKEYKEQLAATMQLDVTSGIKETLMSGLATAGGGILASAVTGAFKKKGGGGGGAPEAAEGGGIGASIKDAGVGMVAGKADELVPGGGALVEGISSQVEAIQEPMEKAMTMGDKLKDLGKGIGQFGRGVGRGIELILKGIAKGVGAFATPQAAIGLGLVTAAFIGIGAALRLAAPAFEAIAPILIKIADVVGNVLVKALEMAGPIITSIFNGIGNVITSIGTAISGIITSIATSIQMFAGLDVGNLTLVAGGITALSVAVGAFGVASFIAGVGKFFGGSIFDDLKDITAYATPIQITADAVQSLANAFNSLSSIDTGALTKVPWGDMEDFASEGGKFVLASSGGGSFALAKDTTDNIKQLATDSKINLQISKNLQALLAVLSDNANAANFQLNIDGKAVTQMIQKRADDRKAQNKE